MTDKDCATRLDDAMSLLADLRENRDVAVDALEEAVKDLEFFGMKQRAAVHRQTLQNVRLMDDQLEGV